MGKTKINVNQAAEIMQLSPCRVRELARAKVIKGYKAYPGARKFYFFKEDIEAASVPAADGGF